MAQTAGVPRVPRVVRIILGVAGALVVVAGLAAVIVPTFLGVTSSSRPREAQSNLTNALTDVAASPGAAGASYAGLTVLQLARSYPELAWVDDGTAQPPPLSAGYPTRVGVDLCADGPACQAVVLATFFVDLCWEGVITRTRAAALAVGVPRAMDGRDGGTFYGNTRGTGPCLAGTSGHVHRPESGWATNYGALPQT